MQQLFSLPDTDQPMPYGGVRNLLRSLSQEDDQGIPPYPWTGKLAFLLPEVNRTAAIYLNEGAIYAGEMAGFTPPVALRLKSAGCINDEELGYYLSLNSAEVGPEAVSRSNVPSEVVEAIHREVLMAIVSHLYEWDNGLWHWEEGEYTNEYITAGIPILLVVSAVDERIGQWTAVARNNPFVVQPNSIPLPGLGWTEKLSRDLIPEMAALLMSIDGHSTIAQIAARCGFTRFEIAKLLSQASSDNVLDFTPAAPAVPQPAPSNILDEEPQSFVPSLENLSDVPEQDEPSYSENNIPAELQEIWEDLKKAKEHVTIAERNLQKLATEMGITLPPMA